MAVLSTRSTTLQYSGDIVATEVISALSNIVSPGQTQLVALAIGTNTITVPNIGTAVATACTILPVAGNLNVITLKGVTGDTGIALHLTDPTTIALASTVVTFVLSTATATTARLFWT